MRISDWSSDVCSSDLPGLTALPFIVPLFTLSNRAQAVAEARACGFTTALSLIDPTAVCPRGMVFEEGCYIGAGTSVGAASRFGSFTFIHRSVGKIGIASCWERGWHDV